MLDKKSCRKIVQENSTYSLQLYFVNSIISFGVQSRTSQSLSSVNTVMPLLCFRLLIVLELIPCWFINVYVLTPFAAMVSHNGL